MNIKESIVFFLGMPVYTAMKSCSVGRIPIFENACKQAFIQDVHIDPEVTKHAQILRDVMVEFHKTGIINVEI